MKSSKVPLYFKSNIICTDGSKINVSFNYNKEGSSITSDIKSNINWLPKSTNAKLTEINKFSNKFDLYKFNFGSLK
jgi:hypothetical protein